MMDVYRELYGEPDPEVADKEYTEELEVIPPQADPVQYKAEMAQAEAAQVGPVPGLPDYDYAGLTQFGGPRYVEHQDAEGKPVQAVQLPNYFSPSMGYGYDMPLLGKFKDEQGYIAKGREGLRASYYDSATGGPIEDIEHLTNLATGILIEGGTYEDYEAAMPATINDDYKHIGWNAAVDSEAVQEAARMLERGEYPVQGGESKAVKIEQPLTEDELLTNPDLRDAAETLYYFWEGEDFQGTDEELQRFLEWELSMFNNNYLKQSATLMRLKNAPPVFAKSMLALITAYNNTPTTWDQFGRGLFSVMVDPASYVSLGTAGISARMASAGMKKTIAKVLMAAAGGAVAGGVEGGVYGTVDEYMDQLLQKGAGERESLDYRKMAKSGAIGVGIGTVAGGGLGGIVSDPGTKFIQKQVKQGKERLADQGGFIVVKRGEEPVETMRGINVRNVGDEKYADMIVSGEKTLETRDTDSLKSYVGERVQIIRTGEGDAQAIGSVVVGEPIEVTSKKQWEELREQHKVPKGSKFDYKKGKVVYPLEDPIQYKEPVNVKKKGQIGAKELPIPDDEITREAKGKIKEFKESPQYADALDESIPESSPYKSKVMKTVPTKGKTEKVEYEVQKNVHGTETRVFEIAMQPSVLAKTEDGKVAVELTDWKQAREFNANPERVAGWQKIYDQAETIEDWGKEARKAPAKAGKLAGIEGVSLTKGCQRSAATVERVRHGVLPQETRLEACYGGDCWVNKQFNAKFGSFENMEIRDLKMATPESIEKWWAGKAGAGRAKTLNKSQFVRMGYAGDDSHAIATGLAEKWLAESSKAGLNKPTIFISAGYAPVTDEAYQSLAKYADKFEMHFSLSGWFDKNEIMLRMGEFMAAREAGVPAKMRIITNKDNISGMEMVNEGFLDELIEKYGIRQDEILETPYHDDALRGKKGVQDRSEPSGKYQFICCETGKCKSCGPKCMSAVESGVKLGGMGAGSVATTMVYSDIYEEEQ